MKKVNFLMIVMLGIKNMGFGVAESISRFISLYNKPRVADPDPEPDPAGSTTFDWIRIHYYG